MWIMVAGPYRAGTSDPDEGADAEVASFRARGLPVFGAVDEIPLSSRAAD